MAEKYDIVSQRQTTQLVPGGGFQNVMEVTFRVKSSGVVAHVDIPVDRYNADTVGQAVEAYVDNIEAVHSL